MVSRLFGLAAASPFLSFDPSTIRQAQGPQAQEPLCGGEMLKVPNNTHFLCVIFGTFKYSLYLCTVINKQITI